MIIVLLGYMASGKSTIGKILANNLSYDFVDLDDYIEVAEKCSIKDIFKKQGEIYFRKKEAHYLSEILAKRNNVVLALGGGTPCYGNNMKMLVQHENTITIYLKATIESLAKRLENEKDKRPIISHLNTRNELIEFIGKHLFERMQYYSQAKFAVDTNNKSEDKIIEDIIFDLF